MVLGLLAESLPQDRNVPCEPAFLDDGVTPDPLEQLILGENAIPVLDQDEQRFERLGSQRHRFSVEQQEPLAAIQAERPELVGGLRPLHSATNISEEKRSPIVRTSDRSPG